MFVCPVCEVENRSDAKFCRKCGQSRTALEQYAAVTMGARGTQSSQSKADEPQKSSIQPASPAVPPTQSKTIEPQKPASQPARPAVPEPQAKVKEPQKPATAPSQSASSTAPQAQDKAKEIAKGPEAVPPAATAPEPPPPSWMQSPITPFPGITATVAQISPLETTQRPPTSPSDNNGAGHEVSSKAGSAQPSSVTNPLPAAGTEQPGSPECPSCWTVLRWTDKFCCWCGEPQPNRALPFMKLCLECSTQLPEKANFCYSCGNDMTGKAARKVRFPHELFNEEESDFFPRFDA